VSSALEERVARAARAVLAKQQHASVLEVLSELGWLPWTLVEQWRQGRFEYLHSRVQVSRDKLADALSYLDAFAEREGLVRTEIEYREASRDQRVLRFTQNGDADLERWYRTQLVSPALSEAKRKRLAERQNKAPDLVVLVALGDWTCAGCGATGPYLFMEHGRPHCLDCVDLGHLVFLPAGNAALSRRAKQASGLAAVVVRLNSKRKRYERQGILVEEAALELAEEQCLADEDIRERRRERDRERRAHQDVEFQARFADKIIELFPHCPPPRAEAIAQHAGTRGSGRVGRSAAGRALDDNAVTLAVIASIRHEDTAYDQLLMSGVDRQAARDQIAPAIDHVLTTWRPLG
jgi:hypothetical protein